MKKLNNERLHHIKVKELNKCSVKGCKYETFSDFPARLVFSTGEPLMRVGKFGSMELIKEVYICQYHRASFADMLSEFINKK